MPHRAFKRKTCSVLFRRDPPGCAASVLERASPVQVLFFFRRLDWQTAILQSARICCVHISHINVDVRFHCFSYSRGAIAKHDYGVIEPYFRMDNAAAIGLRNATEFNSIKDGDEKPNDG